jgi:hypothetical protein
MISISGIRAINLLGRICVNSWSRHKHPSVDVQQRSDQLSWLVCGRMVTRMLWLSESDLSAMYNKDSDAPQERRADSETGRPRLAAAERPNKSIISTWHFDIAAFFRILLIPVGQGVQRPRAWKRSLVASTSAPLCSGPSCVSS